MTLYQIQSEIRVIGYLIDALPAKPLKSKQRLALSTQTRYDDNYMR
jgi:hypothetical protein